MAEKKDLNRFVRAQERSFAAALAELEAGRKRTHWMWFVFPQIEGLGRSDTARYYAIENAEEAKAFLAHPYLGGNLRRACRALLGLETNDPLAVMGWPDDLKLCSSMTLFEAAAPEEEIFARVLEKYYGGRRDEATLEILERQK